MDYVFVTHDRGLEPSPLDFGLLAISLLELSSLPKFELPEVVTSRKGLSDGWCDSHNQINGLDPILSYPFTA